MNHQFDLLCTTEPAPELVISETTIGEPARMAGYIAKRGKVWMHSLVPAGTFSRYKEDKKLEMRLGLTERMKYA